MKISYAARKSLSIISGIWKCLLSISYGPDDLNVMSGDKEVETQRSYRIYPKLFN